MTDRLAIEPAGPYQRWAWLAGLVAWLAVLLPSVVVLSRRDSTGPSDAAFLGALLLFGALFVVQAGPWEPPSVRRARVAWIGATVACAIAAALLAPQVGVVPVLFILTSVLAAHVLPARHTYALVAIQTLATAVATTVATTDPLVIGVQTAAIAGFQVFAAATTLAMVGERALRRRLAQAYAELGATRSLLRESARFAERGRISRELHDLVGHHLTALNLNLEVASHVAEGQAAESVARSRAIARLLLSEVRDVVSDLRSAGELDVAQVLRELITDLPRPRVHLEVEPGIAADDVEHAHVIVRCVQEAITNAIRHADADNVWVTVRTRGDAVDVLARDDGRGADDVAIGNGLVGMRERVDGLGGRLDIVTAPGAGFAVHALIPRAASGA